MCVCVYVFVQCSLTRLLLLNSTGGWFKVGQKEGIRIMEQGTPKDYRHTPTSDVVVVNGTLMKSESLQDTLLQIISPRPPDNHSISVDSGNASQVVCRKCQAVVPACPVNVFLALMKTLEGEYCWPTTPGSCFKVQCSVCITRAMDYLLCGTLRVMLPLSNTTTIGVHLITIATRCVTVGCSHH